MRVIALENVNKELFHWTHVFFDFSGTMSSSRLSFGFLIRHTVFVQLIVFLLTVKRSKSARLMIYPEGERFGAFSQVRQQVIKENSTLTLICTLTLENHEYDKRLYNISWLMEDINPQVKKNSLTDSLNFANFIVICHGTISITA